MTDQPKWTKGPWRADGEPWNRIVWSSADNRVCFMAHSSGLNDARDIATSNLIAAAPDMYAALDAAMAFIESHVADPDITDVMIRNYRTLQDLRPRDVLAKARGETK